MEASRGNIIFKGVNYPIEELEDLSNELGLGKVTSRISKLLLIQISILLNAGGKNISKIIREIEIFEWPNIYPERIPLKSTTKPEEKFKRQKLGGLYHKHFLEDDVNSLLLNIAKPHISTCKYKKSDAPEVFDKLSEEIFNNIKEGDDVNHIINSYVYGGYKNSKSNSTLTGEWLVYAKEEGLNYYLCIGEHGNDEIIRSQIDSICLNEFPFIKNQLRY